MSMKTKGEWLQAAANVAESKKILISVREFYPNLPDGFRLLAAERDGLIDPAERAMAQEWSAKQPKIDQPEV